MTRHDEPAPQTVLHLDSAILPTSRLQNLNVAQFYSDLIVAILHDSNFHLGVFCKILRFPTLKETNSSEHTILAL